ncbi:hypothetical protein ACFL35_07715 [Candidatus Riflebacteria bacterium]
MVFKKFFQRFGKNAESTAYFSRFKDDLSFLICAQRMGMEPADFQDFIKRLEKRLEKRAPGKNRKIDVSPHESGVTISISYKKP